MQSNKNHEIQSTLQVIVRKYIFTFRPRAQKELDWFMHQPTLRAAITHAALARNSEGRRYRHQCRLQKTTLELAKDALLTHSNQIEKVRDFESLIKLVERIANPIQGLGELYIYDTSLRIGARKSDCLPTQVYLHAGTRVGARALGLDSKLRTIEVSRFPVEFKQLEPHEIEDVLCIFKDRLKTGKGIDHDLSRRGWCG